MTTTSQTQLSANGRGAVPGSPAGGPLPVRQRRPGYVVIAIVLIVGLGALGAYFYTKAGQKTPVVMVAKDVPAGHRIERSDLTTVNVAGGITAVAGSHLDSVLGQVATVELLPGTPLQRAMVTSANPLPAGSSKVGVELRPGQLPAGGIDDGAKVQVLQLPNKNSTSASTPQNATVLATSATVYQSASDPSQTGGTLVTLIVPSDNAPAIAAASSSGLVALVQVGS